MTEKYCEECQNLSDIISNMGEYIRMLKFDLAAHQDMLLKVEWGCYECSIFDHTCPSCGREKDKGHRDDCALGRFLAEQRNKTKVSV